MLIHVVSMVMLSGLLPISLQEAGDLVLAHSKDGKRYIASIDEDVGADYSRAQGKVTLLAEYF